MHQHVRFFLYLNRSIQIFIMCTTYYAVTGGLLCYFGTRNAHNLTLLNRFCPIYCKLYPLFYDNIFSHARLDYVFETQSLP